MRRVNRISGYWWCQIAGWGVVGLSFIFAAYSFRQPITLDYLLKIAIVMIGGIVSTHLLRLFILRKNWMLLPIEKVLVRLAIAAVPTTLLASLLVLILNQVAGVQVNRHNLDFLNRILANFLTLGIFIIPWALIYYFYHYMVKSRKQQLDTLKLESLVKELELETIKSHINPHFIFNALNSIRALIDEDPDRARSAVTHLSNILRSSMKAEKMETVPLERELNIVKDYLALEHIRFEERLQIEYDIEKSTLYQPVPPMMLQTLVENAIKHGIGQQVGGGLVRICSFLSDNFHQLEVHNTGLLNSNRNADGFGLSSTRNRLYLLFGEQARFEITQEGELVMARVSIPVPA